MAKSKTHKQFYNMFVEHLQDIYSAESQMIDTLPRYIEAISTDDLREKLRNHFKETKKQQTRLNKVFDELNASPKGKFCEGMKGLLKECDEIVNEDLPGVVKDAALISALQKCEHYEIASYGALRTFAKHLELDSVHDTLEEILDEEWSADQKLTKIAEGGWFMSGINAEAVQ